MKNLTIRFVVGLAALNMAMVARAASDPSLTMSVAQQTYDLNQPIDYSLSAKNVAGGDTVVTDTLASGMTYVGTSLPNGSCTVDTSGTTPVVTCDLGNLAAGATKAFTITNKVTTIHNNVTFLSTVATAKSGSATSDPQTVSVQINTQAALTLQILPGPSSTVGLGDAITYQLLIVNSDNFIDAANVVIHDTLPAGLTSVTVPSNCTVAGTAVTCTIGTVGHGATSAVTIGANAPSTVGTIVNNANATSDNAPTTQAPAASISVQALTDLGITETGPSSPVQGVLVTYQVTVKNFGSFVAADNTSVSITLPFTPSAMSPSCTGATSPVTCTVGTLAAQQSVVLTVSGTPTAPGTVTSNSSVTSTTSDNGRHSTTAQWTMTVVPNSGAQLPSLSLREDVNTTQSVNNPFNYIFTVKNNGAVAANNVVVTDVIPATFNFQNCTYSGSDGSSGVCVHDAKGQPLGSGQDTVTYTFPKVDPGVSVTMFLLVDPTAAKSQVVNTITATSTNDPGSPLTAQATTTVLATPTADPLQLQKFVLNGYALLNSNFPYTVKFSNPNSAAIGNVTVTDPLPAGMKFLDVNETGDFTCSNAHNAVTGSDTLTCPVGTMTAGAGKFFTVDVQATKLGTVVNTASIASDDSAPTPNASASIQVVNGTNLVPVVSGFPAKVLPSAPITYKITVTNHGLDAGKNVLIKNTLPTGWVLNSVTSNYGPGSECDVVYPAACFWPTIPAGQNVVMTVTATSPATPDAPGHPSTFSAVVTNDLPDTNPASNTTSWSTTVEAGSNVTINQTGVNQIPTGIQSSYAVQITNNGPAEADATTISDTLFASGAPGDFDTISATFPGGTCTVTSDPLQSSSTIHCPLGTVPAGTTILVTVHFTPRVPSSISSKASVTTSSLDSATSNSDTLVFTAVPTTNLSVSLFAPAQVTLSDSINYTMAISNTSQEVAASVQAQVKLDPSLGAPTGLPAQCSYASHIVTCTVGAVNPSPTPVSITFSAMPSVIGTVSSTATVTTPTFNLSSQQSQSATTHVVNLTNPVVAQAAAANPNPVTTGTTTSLSVLGSNGSDYPESALKYQWLVSGPAPVSFADTGASVSANTNAAKNDVATFTSSGTYHFSVIITNPAGGSVTSAVTVVVLQGFGNGVGSIVISPNPGSVLISKTLQFTAVANDQFNHPLGTQPTFAWSATAGGTMNAATGVFTAGTVTNTFTNAIVAKSQGDTGTATVIVANDVPVISQATANPNPVTTGTTTTLKVTATDVGFPESALVYQWTATGPAPVTFSDANKDNAAKNNVATFTSAGTYHFIAMVTNPAGATASSSVDVVVDQGFGNGVGSIVVTPNPGSVLISKTLQFGAVADDQFHHPLTTQPTFTWSATAGGTINPTTGLFTAGTTSGSFANAIAAKSQGDTGTATVIVGTDLPVISQAKATPNPVTTGTTTNLSVTATDVGFPESSLVYQWTVTGPKPVTFSDAGKDNGAKNNVATFTSAGSYHFIATVTNPLGATASSSVDVVVDQGFGNGVGSIVVTPNPLTVAPSQTGSFTASAFDQFHNPLLTQPVFTWAASAGGTINSSGLFTAGATAGTFTNAVSASASGDTGRATVIVSPTAPGQHAPVLISLNPDSVIAGSPTFIMTLTGSNFVSGAVVTWNGAARPTTFLSPTKLQISVPAADIDASHENTSVTIGVTNPDTQRSNTLSFAITSNTAGDFITVDPANKTIQLGDTLQLTAHYFHNNQEVPGVTFTWTSPGAQVNAVGFFRSPSDIRSDQHYTVTASARGINGHSNITVAVPTVPQQSVCGGDPYPVPYKSTMGVPGITFRGLIPNARIRIFTSAGQQVQEINVPSGGSQLWDLRNSDGKGVASWVYLYVIDQPNGSCSEKTGKLVIIK